LFDFFAGGVLQFEVKGNSFLVNNLKKNKNYYWRVRPYNHWNTCGLLTEARSFKTGNGQTTAVNDVEGIDGLEVMPNPVSAGQTLEVELSITEPLQLSVELTKASGATVQQMQWSLPAGTHTRTIPVSNLTPGLYFIQIRSEKGVTSRKVVVGK
jgi:hypothetical protein